MLMNFRVTPAAAGEILAAAERSGAQGMALRVAARPVQDGIDGTHDGVLVHNLLASYTHLRSGAGSQWASRFVAHVRDVRQRRPAPPETLALAA